MYILLKTTNTNTMAMTIDMLANRVETLEKQLALLLKQDTTEVDVSKSKKEKKSKVETSDDDLEVKKTKKSKKETSSDDEVKKKRGTNGYILFSKSVRDEVIAKLSVGDEKPKNTEIMKQQAAMWAEVDDDTKAEWTAKAKELNAKAE